MSARKIQSALISVFYKEGLEPIVRKLADLGIQIYSTGGTETFIRNLGIEVIPVEQITDYPSIFGGRVKTLHPKVFGGILHRRDNPSDQKEKTTYEIPAIDLVIVDLYPFEETVASGADENAIIEKIDIGGIALIRGAAKNFQDVLIVPSRGQYEELIELLDAQNGETTLAQRKHFATCAFNVSSHYDSEIFNYLNQDEQIPDFKQSIQRSRQLRYGENPHQKGIFHGDFNAFFDQLHGKDVSYNNLIDIDASVQLIAEFQETCAFGILKHNNACGFAIADTVKKAYELALEADPISAFGGILVTNEAIDAEAAEEMHKLFFEIVIAPDYSKDALAILTQKKNRIILRQKQTIERKKQFRSLLNGVIEQETDWKTDSSEDLKVVTTKSPNELQTIALLFASKICKHTKSNTIVLASENQLFASGVGQTSRVDALEQAIAKAKKFNFDLNEAVMASDAFFPFPDCVEIADREGIKAVIQPGGSVKDQLSIDYCNSHEMTMVFTGHRHFKH